MTLFRQFILLFAAIPAAFAAFDVTQPAHVRIRVVDEAGNPVPEARVALDQYGSVLGERRPEQLTDADGIAAFELRHADDWDPIDPPFWSAYLSVDKPEYVLSPAAELNISSLFPTVERELTVVLDRTTTTLIRFRSFDGKPLPYVPFGVPNLERNYYSTPRSIVAAKNGPLISDENGEFRLEHSRAAPSLQILPAGPTLFGGFDRMNRIFSTADGPIIDFRLTPYQTANVVRGRPVEGRALLADGSPAAGWILATSVSSVGTESITPPGGTRYQINRLGSRAEIVLPADGSFQFLAFGSDLVLVSPEGVPFRFPINSQVWPDGLHNLLLRLPAVVDTFEGRATDADGAGIANLPMTVSSVVDDEAQRPWQFEFRSTEGPRPTSPVVTDAEGRFTAPVYEGRTIAWSTDGAAEGDFATAADSTLIAERPVPDPVTPSKHLILRVRDEQGNRTPAYEELLTRFHLFNIPSQPDAGLRYFQDGNGVHLFVPVDAAELIVAPRLIPQTNEPLSPLERTIAIGNADEQVLNLTVGDSERMTPLRGRLLGADGQPVPGALVWASGPTANNSNWSIQSPPETNANGEFEFTGVPSVGVIGFTAGPNFPEAYSTPGLLAPRAEFSAESRDLTVRLQALGSVRIRIPEGMPMVPPPDLALVDEARPSLISSTWVKYDVDSGTLFAARVPPGNYTLRNRSEQIFGNLDGLHLNVESSQETFLDLSDPSFLATPERVEDLVQPTAEVRVLLDGMPFAGAIVWTYPVPVRAGASITPDGDLTDADGVARFPGPRGTRQLFVATAPGFAAASAEIEFGSAEPVEVSLVRTADATP